MYSIAWTHNTYFISCIYFTVSSFYKSLQNRRNTLTKSTHTILLDIPIYFYHISTESVGRVFSVILQNNTLMYYSRFKDINISLTTDIVNSH